MSADKTNGARRLTTHVLDTASGKPAAGLAIALYSVVGDDRTLLKSVVTNHDGRCDGPLLEGDAFTNGVYELVFEVGQYFERSEAYPFLASVPIRFGISASDEHYHVPLLVSPFGFSTYRGS